MLIYDCFLFYNEFDLLELRLRELYDHVDRFVIIESDHTLTNRAKPYLFEKNKNRYAPWLDKIIHIRHKSLCHADPWVNVYDQRNAVRDIYQCVNDNDIIILNDADEILRSETIATMRKSSALLFGVYMPIMNFKFNFMRIGSESYQVWTTAARASWLKKFGGQMLRNQIQNVANLPHEFGYQSQRHTLWPKDVCIVHHGGWHFSYLGDRDFVIDKIQNTVHQEDNNPWVVNNIDIERSIALKKSWNTPLPFDYECVDLDDYFPDSCRLFGQHCLPDSGLKARQFLSAYEPKQIDTHQQVD